MTETDRATVRGYLAEKLGPIEQALDKWVPDQEVEPSVIHQAMRYSLFAGGKRIRPILAMPAAESIVPASNGVVDAAITLELIHTYSLIHDDLPALDND